MQENYSFNLLTGIYAPTSGRIRLNINGQEKEIQGLKPNAICNAGIARTFQNIRLFRELTVLDNVCYCYASEYELWSVFGIIPFALLQERRKTIDRRKL